MLGGGANAIGRSITMAVTLGGILAGCLLAATRAQVASPHARPTTDAADASPTTRPGRPVVTTVPAWLGRTPQEQSPPALCLGGGSLIVTIAGTPNANIAWELRADKLTLARGKTVLDTRGLGLARAVLPKVLVRNQAELSVSQGPIRWRRAIQILPSSPLRHVRETLRQRNLGVLDPCSNVCDALRDQRIAFVDLAPQLRHDFFQGEIAILAGFDDANALSHACLRLENRVRLGAALVVLNPPAGFRCLGADRKELPDNEPKLLVKIDAELTGTLRPGDFSALGQAGLVDTGDKAIVLAWLERPTSKHPTRQGATTRPAGTNAKRAIVAARPLGKGIVLVATMPELADCYDNPAGRCMLSEIILWILKRPWRPKENT